jgi:3-oxoacyl-[acyl-carrier-protein] synthase-3
MLFPSCASVVQAGLGATKAGAFDMSTGCTGFVYGLATATGFIQSGIADHVLVIAAETISRIVNWEDRRTCVLFGDGAGAALVGPAAPGMGIRGFELWSDGANGDYLKQVAGGSRRPLDEQVLQEKAHLLTMDGHEVFRLAVRGCPAVARAVMARVGVTHDDIDWVVLHQANRRILEATARRLEIPEERVYCDVERYGNTSAATIPLAMDDMYKEGKLKTGDTILLAGFGAGFSLAGCILEWTK